MCKTSVKKNLYWEIKDKVVEETFDGIRMNRRPQKVKVYGTNSTKDVRARLIDILRERVMYHKDKFVAPILHAEMSAMEVKNNGKVEHSANSHDDQVFSYLMALYVWYDGKNLAQNFGIVKNTLKTDDAEEMEEAGFEDQLESRETIDVRKLNNEANEFDEQLDLDLQWIENDMNRIKSVDKFEEEQASLTTALRTQIMNDPRVKKSLDNENFGVEVTTSNISNYYTKLPDSLFGFNDEEINVDDWDRYGVIDAAHQPQTGPKITGNLADLYNRL